MAAVPVSAAKMAAVHTAGGGGTPPVRGMAVRGTWRGTIKLSVDDAASVVPKVTSDRCPALVRRAADTGANPLKPESEGLTPITKNGYMQPFSVIGVDS